MRIHLLWVVYLGMNLMGTVRGADVRPQNSPPDAARQLREYCDFAMSHEGNPARGKTLFNDERRLACAQCHTVDGASGKAGPDLLAIGDKFPRRELIRAVQEPSASIAIGYGSTTVQTKAGEEYQGVLKEVTADRVDLMDAAGNHLRIATGDIKEQ